MEEWKSVGFNNYQISNKGQFRNGDKILKGGTRSGYLTAQYNKQRDYIHKLVALHFIGERPDGFLIDHIDRNKQNNNVENLRYVSVSDNNKNSLKCNTELVESDPVLRHRERSRLYELKNKDKVQTWRVEWKEKNKDRLKEYYRQYYLTKKQTSQQ